MIRAMSSSPRTRVLIVLAAVVVVAAFAALIWFIGRLSVVGVPPGQIPY